MIKLSEILFETEDYYKYHSSSSGKLNTKEARIDLLRYLKKGITQFAYVPNGLTAEAANETDEPNNKGMLEPRKEVEYSGDLVFINTKNKQIIFGRKAREPLLDPRIALQLSSIASTFPEFLDYAVYSQSNEHPEPGKQVDSNLIPLNSSLRELLANKKDISGKYKQYDRKEEKYEEYKVEVLKDITEIDWYHATRKSNWNAIKRFGLVPSKEFVSKQAHGWTVLNFDLQNAVYLTSDLDYAIGIAETLAGRFNEAAIVLKVKGSALKDRTKIVVDEDSLRNDYDGEVSISNMPGMPEYLTSVLDSIKSIAYAGTITPNFISLEQKIDSKSSEKENEND
jgi:hypothetical protein